jgi:putative ABC transport system permease protein
MAMSTRERTSEYAMMRSIGFRPKHVIGMVLGEAVVVATLGFAAGGLIAPGLITGFSDWGQKQFGSFFRNVDLSPRSMAFAAAAALVGAVIATGLPALRAGRMSIVDALRRVE